MKIFIAHTHEAETTARTVEHHLHDFARIFDPENPRWLDIRKGEDRSTGNLTRGIQPRIDVEVQESDALIAVFGNDLGEGGTVHEIEWFLKAKPSSDRWAVLLPQDEDPDSAKHFDSVLRELKQRLQVPDVHPLRYDEDNLHEQCCILAHNLLLKVACLEGQPDTTTSYSPEMTLAGLQEGDQLIVASRTAYRWLGRPEGRDLRKESILRAVRELKAQITFLVQDWLDLGYLPDGGQMMKDAKASRDVFRSLGEALAKDPCVGGGLRMLVVRKPIWHSRVVLRRPTDSGTYALVRLVYDFALPSDVSGAKPFVVVRDETLAASTLGETDAWLRQAVPVDLLKSQEREDVEKLFDSLKRFDRPDGYSRIRYAQHRRLLRHAVRLAEDACPPVPLSVQLLVTSRCATSCPMCTLYKMGDAADDLSTDELKHLLREIHSLGTRSVVLSGGEPLARNDITQILRHARHEGLYVGLLTRGLIPNHGGPSVPADSLLETVADTVSWLQLSIDSFGNTDRSTKTSGPYEKIKQFGLGLRRLGFSTMHISCTVQRDNVSQLSDPELYQQVLKDFPGAFVRFKFAHGPWGVDQYVVGRTELEQLLDVWDSLANHEPWKTQTNLGEMLRILSVDRARGEDKARDCLLQGLPVAHMFSAGGRLEGETCRVLSTTMVIDHRGDVYPCCYLYNDNLDVWEPRGKFRIGSWRSNAEEKGQSLLDLWQCDKFKGLRQSTLPIHTDACGRCTRHHGQNTYWKELARLLGEHPAAISWIEKTADDPTDERTDPIWL
jgi:MoaA/NifB/PqqE/SkfB family radical SAM enzyme